MAIDFRVVPHDFQPGVSVVLVLKDGEFVASIYPEGENGIKIVSAHITEEGARLGELYISDVRENDGRGYIPPIPSVHIRFDPQPYTIQGGRIIKLPQSS